MNLEYVYRVSTGLRPVLPVQVRASGPYLLISIQFVLTLIVLWVQSDARTLVLRTVYTTVRKPFRYVASTDIEAEPGGGEGREKRAGGGRYCELGDGEGKQA